MDLEIETYQPKTEFYETRHAQRGWQYTAGLGWMIVLAHNSDKLAFFLKTISCMPAAGCFDLLPLQGPGTTPRAFLI
jgi:hypothetical protein